MIIEHGFYIEMNSGVALSERSCDGGAVCGMNMARSERNCVGGAICDATMAVVKDIE